MRSTTNLGRAVRVLPPVPRRQIARPEVADDLNAAFLASGGQTLNPTEFGDEVLPVYLFPPPTQALRRITAEQQNGGAGVLLLSSTIVPNDRYRWLHLCSLIISAVGTATVAQIDLVRNSDGAASTIAVTTTMIAGNIVVIPRSIIVPTGYRLDFSVTNGNAASQIAFRMFFIEYKIADPHPFL